MNKNNYYLKFICFARTQERFVVCILLASHSRYTVYTCERIKKCSVIKIHSIPKYFHNNIMVMKIMKLTVNIFFLHVLLEEVLTTRVSNIFFLKFLSDYTNLYKSFVNYIYVLIRQYYLLTNSI